MKVKDTITYQKIENIEDKVVEEKDVNVNEEDAALLEKPVAGEDTTSSENVSEPSDSSESGSPSDNSSSLPVLSDTVEYLPSQQKEVPKYREVTVVKYRPAGVTMTGNLLLTTPSDLPDADASSGSGSASLDEVESASSGESSTSSGDPIQLTGMSLASLPVDRYDSGLKPLSLIHIWSRTRHSYQTELHPDFASPFGTAYVL